MKLLRYIQGLRKGKDAHRIEQDAMTDPFLADALDGFDEVDGNHAERIERMQRRVTQLSQKDRHIAATLVAAKKAVIQPPSEVMEKEAIYAEMSIDEAGEAIHQEPLVPEKKKRRSLVVWLAAAVMLLFLATGGYFWLLEEEPTVLQLATTENTRAKDAISNKEADIQEEVIEPNEDRVLAQEIRETAIRRDQQMQAASAPSQAQDIPPAVPIIDDSKEETILAEVETNTFAENFDRRLILDTELDSVLNPNKLKLNDSNTSNLFAHKEVDKLHPSAGIAAINADELGIYSNTNRSALSQTLSGKATGDEISEKKYFADDSHNLTQSQLFSQGKISGRLSEQSKPTTSRADQRNMATSIVPVPSSAQTSGSVTGRIVDQNGEPLPLAIVQVKGSTTATTTDIDGYFALNAKNAEKLVASYIGYDKIELPADTTKPMTIALNENTVQLDEMVVTGYGVNRSTDYSPNTDKTIPEPEMGYSAYNKYISNNQIKPTDECASVKGRVVLTFNVNSSGRPYNIQVKRSLCPSADKEAIRLVNEGGRWTIGDGEVRFTIKF